MRLLVSVRSAAEVAAAARGGADIVDAKEPALGSLGAVSLPVLRAIAEALPAEIPLSVALGDPADLRTAAEAVTALDALPRPRREVYVKLGLAGVHDPDRARALIGSAVAVAVGATARPRVVVVAYADHEQAGVPAPEAVAQLAAEAGAYGVLIDTYSKGGGDLLSWLDLAALRAWAADARARGLLVALAGSLSGETLGRLAGVPADVVGVRGAACEGGRGGWVSEARVRALREALDGPRAATA
jgi:uncharacterized protein (UPF0264 family)